MKIRPRKKSLIGIALILIIGALGYTGWHIFVKQPSLYTQSPQSALNTPSVTPTNNIKEDTQPAVQPPIAPIIASPQASSQNTSTAPLGTASGKFVQPEGSKWPATQTTIYIGVSVDGNDNASRVEWYLNDFSASPLYSQSSGLSSSSNTLYQFDWNVSNLKPGTYRIVAKVFDKKGNFQIVTNNIGAPYLDTTVKS